MIAILRISKGALKVKRNDAEGVDCFDMQREPFVRNGMLVLFTDGDGVTVTTQGDAARFLLISGKPVGEPAAGTDRS
jgi:hypothetical protein